MAEVRPDASRDALVRKERPDSRGLLFQDGRAGALAEDGAQAATAHGKQAVVSLCTCGRGQGEAGCWLSACAARALLQEPAAGFVQRRRGWTDCFAPVHATKSTCVRRTLDPGRPSNGDTRPT
jgi:hypothetical protein